MTEAPKRIGRYQIDRVLGRGSMGVIYKAHDPEIERPVAIKLVRCGLLHGQERADYLARFRREAQMAGRCIHPNIVALYDYAMHNDSPFLAMEYVEGENLADAISRGARFSIDEATSIVVQILDALACMHAADVTHRDVKPANVLLLENGRVKVTDFGISRISHSGLTMSGLVLGTPSYMSPEQCRGEEVDYRSDLFSAGVIMFELLTGERPFPGRSFTEVMPTLLGNQEAPDLAGRVPEALAAVIRRSIAKVPECRFPSAQAQAEALRTALLNTGQESTIIIDCPGPGQPRPRSAPAATVRVDQEALSRLERHLARHLGPIARVLVAAATKQAASFDAICCCLAENIESRSARESLLRAARQEADRLVERFHTEAPVGVNVKSSRPTSSTLSDCGTPGTGLSVVSPAGVQFAQSELAKLVGPIAPLLVKGALLSCTSHSDFWERLSQHIDNQSDRAAFRNLRTRD